MRKRSNALRPKKKMRRYVPIYLMALPALIYIVINNYIPMGGMVIAFKNYKYNMGIWGSDWAGFGNFEFLFKTKDAWLITRNTILYNAAFIILDTILAIALAILLNEIRSKKMKKFYQTAILLPYLLSMVIVSYLVYGFLSPDQGFVNKTLMAGLGLDGQNWYTKPEIWPFIIVFVHIWVIVGYNCIIYLSTLVGVDKSYYEAADVDGATMWQKIRYITLPCLKPTMITMILLSIGRIFYSDFGLFYQVPLNSGALYDVTSTIDTYVYRGLMQSSNVGMSSAAGVYQSVVGFILVLVANGVVNKVSKENALF